MPRCVLTPMLAACLTFGGGCLLLGGCSSVSGSQGTSQGTASGEASTAVQATVPEDITALVVEAAMAGSDLPAQVVYADEQGEGAADGEQADDMPGAAILDEATMSPAQAAAQVLDVGVVVDDAARTVSIAAMVPDGMALADACVAGNALAYLVSASSEVSADGAAVEEMPYEQGPGVLWDAYVCLVSLDNESGTLDLDGCKPLDATRIAWQ